jgi:ATP-dependent Clp protease protease subunit
MTSPTAASPWHGQAVPPGWPSPPDPQWPPRPPGRPAPPLPPVSPTRVWRDFGCWPDPLQERLLQHRIVIASGELDDAAATRLCAQLLTLDAEGGGAIQVQLMNLSAGLDATLTAIGVLDVLRSPVRAFAAGHLRGPAVGVLAACPQRQAHPNATFTLSEPRAGFNGTATELTTHEERLASMVDALHQRLAAVTGRAPGEIREDARRGRFLTAAQAVSYGLVQAIAKSSSEPAAP